MQKLLYFLILLPLAGKAQFPEDARRYGYPTMNGTARNMAIGGAMGSLGGDITAAHINPAGIGLYKNTEVVITPGFQFGNYDYLFQENQTESKKSGFQYGTSGFVFGSMNNKYRKATSTAFSLSVNQVANFNSNIQYSGQNNQSSWSEQYVEQLVRDRATIPQAEQNYILGSSLAFWTFLVDTLSDAGGNVIGYQSLVPLSANGSQFINQSNQIETRGGVHEISLAFANNYSDKFYAGMSVNFPIYSFKKDQVYREEDASNNLNNDFANFEYRGTSETNGFGLNAKMGLIFKPVEKLRLGLAFHTPSIVGLTDRYTASITANTERYTVFPQPITKTSDDLIIENQNVGSSNPDLGEYEYSLTTPYRFIGSASFVINEVSDVKRQKGFITADIEYVNHRGVRYSEVNEGDAAYYDNLNELIKSTYKGAINLKVGGEMKFEKIMARAGFATYGNPYAEKTGLKTTRSQVSGGLGYRHLGMFVDLTYVHSFIGDTHIPYFLTDKPNPIAEATNSRGAVILTLGFKL
jgi:hypothetical protein